MLRCSMPHWIELMRKPQRCPALRRALQWIIALVYHRAFTVAIFTALVIQVVPTLRARHRGMSPVGLSAILLLAFVALSRLAFFSFVDAALFRIAPRYLLPVAPLLACAAILWLDTMARRMIPRRADPD
jgi:hypothetical protein